MSSTTVRFPEVTWPVVKNVHCARCGRGRKIRRSRTLVQTINPWNVIKDGPRKGQPKTREDILIELRDQAAAWTPVAMHPPCKCPWFTDAIPQLTAAEKRLLRVYSYGPTIPDNDEQAEVTASLEGHKLVTRYDGAHPNARALTPTGRWVLGRLEHEASR